MKTSLKLAALLLGVLAIVSLATAESVNLNFDSTVAAVDANTFAVGSASWISFHNAVFAPDLDSFGDPVSGSDHWQIDTASDTSFPVQVDSTSANGWGAAPSGSFALDARPQSILVKFDQTYDLSAFSVTLDNSTFGNLGTQTIDLLSGSSIIGQITIDQTVSGFVASLPSGLANVTGIVMASGAFYDNLVISGSASAIPEPSTWAAILGGLGLGFAVIRRRKA